MRVLNYSTGKEAEGVPDEPFTTSRLVLGQMIPAMKLLARLVKEVDRRPFIIRKFFGCYQIIIHPLEMNEGGHSQVEFRAYMDLAKSISPKGKNNYACSREEALVAEELGRVFGMDDF
ncbi:hypothetical protein [Enterobacillus tribolii]|nr:hypothetical protein [Enterobacillus tribolii]